MFDKLTVLAMATRQMDWLAQRTEVVAQNVANADTPGYTPKDLKPLSFKGMVTDTTGPSGPNVPKVTLVADDPRHIVPQTGSDPNTVVTQHRVYEASPDGNAVNVEDQMAKLGNAKSTYETAAALYQKQVGLLKLAIMGHL